MRQLQIMNMYGWLLRRWVLCVIHLIIHMLVLYISHYFLFYSHVTALIATFTTYAIHCKNTSLNKFMVLYNNFSIFFVYINRTCTVLLYV